MSAQSIVSAAVAIVGPLIGLFLRASRRPRLRSRVDDYLELAGRFEEHDQETAERLRGLARETVGHLERMDRRSLHRKVDPGAVIAILLLVLPAAAGFYLALGWDSWAKWPVLVFTGVWALLWLGAGLTQVFKERSDEIAADEREGASG